MTENLPPRLLPIALDAVTKKATARNGTIIIGGFPTLFVPPILLQNNKKSKDRAISKKGSDDEDQKNKDDCSKQIYSIKGIMVNKYHAEMSFATKEVRRTLQYLPSSRNITQSQKFTMEFYGTQEKQRCNDQVEVKRRTIQRAPSSFLEPGQFRCGRPNWYTILLDSISTAHHHPTTGGCSSVGVFFCGSPAIAHELTINAAKVTAQHHYSIKCLEGKICNCKLIVHCENF